MCHNSLYRLSSNYGMNTQSLVAHKKLLAIIIGVAIFATAGMGAASAQVSTTNTKPTITGSINIEQTLMSKVTVTFAAASTTAAGGSTASPITGGQVISGSLKPMQGSLVYAFKVIDGNSKVYSVIVESFKWSSALCLSRTHIPWIWNGWSPRRNEGWFQTWWTGME